MHSLRYHSVYLLFDLVVEPWSGLGPNSFHLEEMRGKVDRVKRFYDNNPHMEWERLNLAPYNRIEYEVTLHFIHKYLSPDDRIIDIGSGPGRYAIHFMKRQHPVTLVDLSSALLEKARQEIEQRQLTCHLAGSYERNAVDLSGVASNSYDVTLLLGPLYHLTKQEDRKKAVMEALRVTKPGGYIFSAIITRFCSLRDMFRWDPATARAYIFDHKQDIDRMLDSCVYENPEEDPRKFTDAYFSPTQEIADLYDAASIRLVEAFSCEGIAAFLNDKVNQLVDSEKTMQRLLQLIIPTCVEPSMLGAGEHSVFVGQKKF